MQLIFELQYHTIVKSLVLKNLKKKWEATNMIKYKYRRSLVKVLSIIVTVSLLITPFPNTVSAATTKIRQEINIIDAYLYAGNNSYATSSEIVAVTDTSYTAPAYYFEVVASTTAGTNATVNLVNATSSATVATITVDGGNVYKRYRSNQFLPSASSTVEYKVVLGNENIGKGITAARIIVLQSADPINLTQTQIEIGSATTSATNTNTLPLQNPKYWYYDWTKWDATTTSSFSAEVTYKNYPASSSTTYTTATTTDSTSTYVAKSDVIYTVVELWGSGGGGSVGNAGGGGGGGGSYARSTTTPTGGSSHTVFIGNGGLTDTAATADSATYDSTVVVAPGGTGTSANTAGVGGSGGTGGYTANGGGGGLGETTKDIGGGGGGAGGPDGAGVTAANSVDPTPTAGGKGDNGSGGFGGAAGSTNTDTCSTSAGQAGSNNTKGAGGGGGAGSDGTGVCSGGPGGYPGGGGGSSESSSAVQVGGAGQAKLTEWYGKVNIELQEDNGSFANWVTKKVIVSGGTATSSTRVRSSFTPTSGRNYRIVASTTDSTASYDIYNAKIVVDQGVTASNSITEVGSGATAGGASGAHTITHGLSIQSGDVIIAIVYSNAADNSGDVDNNGSTPFTLERGEAGPGISYLKIWKRVAGTSEPTTYSWTGGDTVDRWSVLLRVFRTVDSSIWDVAPSARNVGAGVTATAPTMTTNTANTLGIVSVFADNGSGTYSGQTNGYGAEVETPASTNSQASYTRTWTSAGSTGTVDVTLSATDDWAAYQFALKAGNTAAVAPTKLQPQYLLTNSATSTTGLARFDTLYDSTEWANVGTTYIHQIDSSTDTSDSAKLQSNVSATPADVTNSTATGANIATSTSAGMTMPSGTQAEREISINVLNAPIYASRILVDVAPSVAAVLDNLHYRWRNDDGTESAATWATATNTALTSGIYIGDRRRLRILVSNTGGASASNITYRLEVASSSCSVWVPVPTPLTITNEHWVIDPSSNLGNNPATTDSSGITNPSGKTFVAGYAQTFSNDTAAHTLTTSQFTELEYSIRSTGYVTTGTTYCFRLTNAGSTTNFTYTQQPQAIVSAIVGRPEGGGGSGSSGAGGEGSGSGSSQSGGSQGGGGNTEPPPSPPPGQGGGGQGGGGGDSGYFNTGHTLALVLRSIIDWALK